jgi:hypothetical protein
LFPCRVGGNPKRELKKLTVLDLIRPLLTLISIALGVAVVIAIKLAKGNAAGLFGSSFTTPVGKVPGKLRRIGSVDEAVLAAHFGHVAE